MTFLKASLGMYAGLTLATATYLQHNKPERERLFELSQDPFVQEYLLFRVDLAQLQKKIERSRAQNERLPASLRAQFEQEYEKMKPKLAYANQLLEEKLATVTTYTAAIDALDAKKTDDISKALGGFALGDLLLYGCYVGAYVRRGKRENST